MVIVRSSNFAHRDLYPDMNQPPPGGPPGERGLIIVNSYLTLESRDPEDFYPKMHGILRDWR